MYKAADGRYRSAGTFSTEERALEVAKEAERHALVGGTAGGLDPGIRATRTIKEYVPLFLRHHRVEGTTKERYADTLRLHVIPFLGGCPVAAGVLEGLELIDPGLVVAQNWNGRWHDAPAARRRCMLPGVANQEAAGRRVA